MADTTDNVTLRAEATVNGQLYAVTVEAPRSMWNDSLTDLRPDLGRGQVEAVLRQRLGVEIAKHLDVTVSAAPAEQPDSEETQR